MSLKIYREPYVFEPRFCNCCVERMSHFQQMFECDICRNKICKSCTLYEDDEFICQDCFKHLENEMWYDYEREE